jgi:protein phosphatase-4 regulatory subunit 3
MRGNIFKAVADHQQPLTDILIELLLVEEDQGVKTQMADAIKILLDPTANAQSIDTIVGRANGDFLAKVRNGSSQPDSFILDFYNESAKKLFRPLKDLEHKESSMSNQLLQDTLTYTNVNRAVADLTTQEVSLYVHLVEVLCFFVRQHAYRSKYFLMQENLPQRVAQLLSSPTKHLRLTALKYFRTCIGLHDDFHNRQIINHGIFEPILNIVYETMPRDNLLNSACLEFFEFIKRENMKALTINLVEQFREKLEGITYVETFRQLIDKYEKYTAPPPENMSFTSVDTEQTQSRAVVNGGRWQGLKDADNEEEAYFNGAGDEEEEDEFSAIAKSKPNGASPIKPLVDYPDDDDDGTMDILAQDTSSDHPRETIEPLTKEQQLAPVPERLAEKRRRDEDEEDELTKLSAQPKRRSSSISSVGSAPSTHGQTLRRKKSISSGKDGPPKKISISLAVKSGNAQSESE